MRNVSARFAKDRSAAAVVEYALLVGGISVVVSAAAYGLGLTLNGTFTTVAKSLHQQAATVIVDRQ